MCALRKSFQFDIIVIYANYSPSHVEDAEGTNPMQFVEPALLCGSVVLSLCSWPRQQLLGGAVLVETLALVVFKRAILPSQVIMGGNFCSKSRVFQSESVDPKIEFLC